MQIPRFFLTHPTLDCGQGETVLIEDSAIVNQIRNVLRMKIEDQLVLLDGRGLLYRCRLTAMPPRQVQCEVLEKAEAPGEPPCDVTVGLAVIKGERFEWALQKLCELGVRTIVPLITARTIVKIDTTGDAKGAQAKVNRWQAILKEAAEQSERATVPQIVLPRKLNDFINASTSGGTPALTFICAERVATVPLKDILLEYSGGKNDQLATTGGASNVTINLLIGPEGGFTEDEIAIAQNAGAKPVSLGPRILRAETAAIYAAAQVIWCLEN